MTVKNLAKIASVSEQAIRKKTKKAYDDGEKSICIDDDVYLFEAVIDKKARGKVYQYRLEVKEEIVEEFLEVDFIDRIGRTFLNAPQTAQNRALLKVQLVEKYLKRDSKTSVEKFIKELHFDYDELLVNQQKIFRWVALYRDAQEKNISPAELLVDKRGIKRNIKLTEEMKQMAERMLTSRMVKRDMSAIYKDMQHSFGDQLPSYSSLRRYLEKYKRSHPMFYEFSQNPDGAKNKHMMAFGSMSENVKARNQVWELDSTPADIITSDGKRWAVLAAIDVYSRRVALHLDQRSSSYSISRLLRKAILKFGIPESVVIDNGKDYKSNHFASICHALGIRQEVVPPFSGDMKPHVERFFRRLSGDLFKSLPGYIGTNVAEREKLQSQRSFEDKQASIDTFKKAQRKVFQDGWKVKKENVGLELKITLTSDELIYWIDKWNEKEYEQKSHGGIKMKPIDKWNQCVFPVESIPDERMLHLLLGESFIRTINKKGIQIDGLDYMHVDLAYYAGEKVKVMTPDNMGYVAVFTQEYKPICLAECPEMNGKSRSEFKGGKAASKAIFRQMSKLLKKWEDIGKADPTIRTRIEDMTEVIEAKTQATMKQTETIDAVLEASKAFAKADQLAAEDSHTYNLDGEKLLPSGRPQFPGPYERLLWELENDEWNDKSQRIADKYPDLYAIAKDEFERRKAG